MWHTEQTKRGTINQPPSNTQGVVARLLTQRFSFAQVLLTACVHLLAFPAYKSHPRKTRETVREQNLEKSYRDGQMSIMACISLITNQVTVVVGHHVSFGTSMKKVMTTRKEIPLCTPDVHWAPES